jgi:hypothetical protein
MQNVGDGHETSVTSPPMSVAALQVGVSAAGFVEIRTLPSPASRTQRPVDAHSMSVGEPMSEALSDHVPGVAGLVELSTRPSKSTAAQNVSDGHETDRITFPMAGGCCSSRTIVHSGAGAVGSVVASIDPVLPTATHSDVVAQDTAELE